MNKCIKQCTRKLSNTYIKKYFTAKMTIIAKYLIKALARGMPTSQTLLTYLWQCVIGISDCFH